MKTALVCAIFLSNFAADGRELASVKARCPWASVAVITRCTATEMPRYPAPVAEMTTANGPTVGGVFLRMKTSPEPLLMLSPLAPPEYGSARSLLTFTDDPNRNSNPNVRAIQPNGIRLLTFRTDW